MNWTLHGGFWGVYSGPPDMAIVSRGVGGEDGRASAFHVHDAGLCRACARLDLCFLRPLPLLRLSPLTPFSLLLSFAVDYPEQTSCGAASGVYLVCLLCFFCFLSTSVSLASPHRRSLITSCQQRGTLTNKCPYYTTHASPYADAYPSTNPTW